MKVALIYPKLNFSLDFVGNDGYVKNMSGYPALSLAYVASIIKKAGHEVTIIDGNIYNLNPRDTVKEIKKFQPDLLGFTVSFPTFQGVRQWIGLIKENMNIPVIIGGSFVELYASDFMRHKEIDYIICGSAPVSLPRFLDSFCNNRRNEFYNVPGLCFREGDNIVINGLSFLRDNISDMPFPARELLPNDRYFAPFSERKNFTPFITSKGCLFRCIYCCLSEELQLRDVDDIIAEIGECYHRFKIRDIDFYDSIFTINKERTLEICRRIRSGGFKLSWSARTHINFIDEELLKEMAESGCRMIMYGIESTDNAILKNLKRADISLGKIKEVVRLTRKNGIYAFGFFMLGSPGETEATARNTIRASRQLGLDFVQFTRTTPIPGTELYEDYLHNYKYDYWKQIIIDNRPKQRLLSVKTVLSPDTIVKYVKKGNINFYLRPEQIIRIILGIRSCSQLRNYIRSGCNMIFSYILGILRKNNVEA